ncbi:hypothetical protein GW17_00005454 [Ensete ventricosum]|nr:hypothetical protein GW17_00005454 [Ensete ventricosum]
MSVAGESRDDPTNEENLARRRLLRHGLLLVAFSSSEVKRKRGGLGDIADVSPHSCWEEKTRTCEWYQSYHQKYPLLLNGYLSLGLWTLLPQVVITNLDSELIMNLDVKMWPHASSDDVSSNYKVHNL